MREQFEAAIKAGDRVEWKKLIAEATDHDLQLAWVMGRASGVQDFGDLAFAEMQRRQP